jgi:putative ABC transport system substrate-binding protein
MNADAMQRRNFITLLGGAAAVWPVAVRAQQPAVPVIGYIGVGTRPEPSALAPFSKGLNDMGYIDGRNVAIEFRVTEQYDRLPTLAAELVRRQAAVIYAYGPANAAQAAMAATATIPIVFATGADPVSLGLVASLNRPGRNATGITFFSSALAAKRLEMLRELAPQAATIAVLVNPDNARTEGDKSDMEAAARSVGQQIILVSAGTASEIDTAFGTIARQRAGALLVNGDAFYLSRRDQFVALAARDGIPANYNTREYVATGGLMSYGDDRSESYRQAGNYVGRILKGAKPADLPVLQPTKFDFVINLKTAKALDLTFPPSFHLRATEVIE